MCIFPKKGSSEINFRAGGKNVLTKNRIYGIITHNDRIRKSGRRKEAYGLFDTFIGYVLMIRHEIAAMLILLYLAFTYFSVKRRATYNHALYSGLMICSFLSLLFDMITVYTVNNRETVPDTVNHILHILFLSSIAGVMFFVYLYVKALCKNEKKPKLYSIAPLLMSIICAIVLPFYYDTSEYGDYSQGAAVTSAFVFAFIYILASIFLLIVHRRSVDKKSRRAVIIALFSFIAVTVVQLVIKPILITSVGIIMINLAFFYTVESPDALMIEKLEAERKRADEANKAKTLFLANMSHEIRTPINSMLGLNELILRESREAATLGYAGKVQNAGSTLLSLVNDILDFSKIEEGRMEIRPEQYDVSSLINDIVTMIRAKTDPRGLKLELDISSGIPYLLLGDEVRIKQCALNLLSNAVKFTEKGSVKLKVAHRERPGEPELIDLEVVVTDTGIGIKDEDMAKLFSAFSTSDSDASRSVGGTGIGLSITRQLLKLMEGDLSVKSVFGEGSEFSFTIPQKVINAEPVGDYMKRYELASARYINCAAFTAPDVNVLAVDDTEMNLNVLKGLLKRTKVRIDTVSSGKAAISAAAAKHYDIMLIDHMMPEMDGIETLHILKKQRDSYDTVYIALTANAVSGAREMYLDAGFDDYLAKPVDGKHLEETLKRYISPDKLKEPEESDEIEIVNMPDWLLKIDEIDTDSGIRFCGGPASFLDTLRLFAENVAPGADEIERFRQEGDVKGIMIKVHALKSSALSIGDSELSAMAEHLEAAIKANDADKIEPETEELVWRYRRLGALLTPILAQKKTVPEKELKPITMMELLEAYATLREAAQSFDNESAQRIIDKLEQYRIPDGEKERCTKLSDAVRNFDWDTVEEFLK